MWLGGHGGLVTLSQAWPRCSVVWLVRQQNRDRQRLAARGWGTAGKVGGLSAHSPPAFGVHSERTQQEEKRRPRGCTGDPCSLLGCWPLTEQMTRFALKTACWFASSTAVVCPHGALHASPLVPQLLSSGPSSTGLVPRVGWLGAGLPTPSAEPLGVGRSSQG